MQVLGLQDVDGLPVPVHRLLRGEHLVVLAHPATTVSRRCLPPVMYFLETEVFVTMRAPDQVREYNLQVSRPR